MNTVAASYNCLAVYHLAKSLGYLLCCLQHVVQWYYLGIAGYKHAKAIVYLYSLAWSLCVCWLSGIIDGDGFDCSRKSCSLASLHKSSPMSILKDSIDNTDI